MESFELVYEPVLCTCLVWCRESSHGIMHASIYFCLYLFCMWFVAIILCVDFGANSDCDCEDCSYYPNYQGKWCFMILFLCFQICIRNILLVLHGYFWSICYAWEILVVVELLEIFLSLINAMLSLASSNQGWLYVHAMIKYF